MDPVKLDEIRKKRWAELRAQLEEVNSKLKKRLEEPSLSEMAKFRPSSAGVVKKTKAELLEAYRNREPLIARFNSPEYPCCTAASPSGVVMLPGSQLPSRTASTLLRRRRLRVAPDAATAIVAMDPVKFDEIRKKRRAELGAQLEEFKSELKKRLEEPSLSSTKVTDGAPIKLPEMDKLRPFSAEVVKKTKAELREAYSNREPLIARFNSPNYPCCTAASPSGVVMLPDFSEDVEGKEASELLLHLVL